jgi:Ca2+/H+ antiporter
MKAFNLVLAILFLFSAVLQYNDPDSYLWITIYFYGAALCWLAFRGRYFPKAYLVGIIAYGVYAIFLFFTKDGVWDWLTQHHAENIAATMKAEKPWIEDTREFFGLGILIFAMVMNYIVSKKISGK